MGLDHCGMKAKLTACIDDTVSTQVYTTRVVVVSYCVVLARVACLKAPRGR